MENAIFIYTLKVCTQITGAQQRAHGKAYFFLRTF